MVCLIFPLYNQSLIQAAPFYVGCLYVFLVMIFSDFNPYIAHELHTV
jgi:hypothetical protein